jgi:hypothetical protein
MALHGTARQYRLAYFFDIDGAVNVQSFLTHTAKHHGIEVCFQYMPFDKVGITHQPNEIGAQFGVPMIMNPMIYENLDCTFGQGPKAGYNPIYDSAADAATGQDGLVNSAVAVAASSSIAAAAAAVAAATVLL